MAEVLNELTNGKGILYYNKNDKYKRNRYEGDFKMIKQKELESYIGIMVIMVIDMKVIGKTIKKKEKE